MATKYILGRQAQNRSKIIRYCTVIGITLFLFAIIQTSVLSRVKPFGVTPDIMLSTVLVFSVYCGCYTGAITGITAGFLTDALGSVGFSILPIVYFLIGYIAGYVSKLLNLRNSVSYLVCLAVSLPLRGITSCIYSLLSVAEFHFPTFLLELALPEMLGTAIFGILVFLPIRPIAGWLRRAG